MFLKFLSDSNNFIYHYSLKIKQHLPYNYLFIIGKKKICYSFLPIILTSKNTTFAA